MKQRGLLLDRDGVINVDHAYVGTVDQFEFMPDIFPFLRSAIDRGYILAILTNQAGVARGFYSESDYQNLTAWMLGQLAGEGIIIQHVFACFEHPEGKVEQYSRESYWRKPKAGMVLDAVQKLRLDPMRSVFLGDQLRDLEAADAGGISKKLWLTDKTDIPPEGVNVVRNFDEALTRIM